MNQGEKFINDEILTPYGLECAADPQDASDIIRRTLPDEADEVIARLQDRSDRAVSGKSMDHADFYAFKNANLKRALAITMAFEYDTMSQTCNWIYNHKEAFSDTILDFGCDCGIVTAFMAKTFPDRKITAIDHCKESADAARELCENLGLGNVEIILNDELDKSRKFSTVFSSRTLQENITKRTLGHGTKYMPFLEKVRIQQKLFSPHVKTLKKLMSDDGNLISIERLYSPGSMGAYLTALDKASLRVSPDNISEFSVSELGSDKELRCLIASKTGTRYTLREQLESSQTVDENDDKDAATHAPVKQSAEGQNAEMQLYLDDCRLLVGYYLFVGDEIRGKFGLYQSKKYPDRYWEYLGTEDVKRRVEMRDASEIEKKKVTYMGQLETLARMEGGKLFAFYQPSQDKEVIQKDPRKKKRSGRK